MNSHASWTMGGGPGRHDLRRTADPLRRARPVRNERRGESGRAAAGPLTVMGGMGWPSGETRGTCRRGDWGAAGGWGIVGCIDERAGPDRQDHRRPPKTIRLTRAHTSPARRLSEPDEPWRADEVLLLLLPPGRAPGFLLRVDATQSAILR